MGNVPHFLFDDSLLLTTTVSDRRRGRKKGLTMITRLDYILSGLLFGAIDNYLSKIHDRRTYAAPGTPRWQCEEALAELSTHMYALDYQLRREGWTLREETNDIVLVLDDGYSPLVPHSSSK